MKIHIEIEGVGDVVRASQPGEPPAGDVDGGVLDAGSGPGSAEPDGADDGSEAADTGPPPDWLLDAVAAAEAEGIATTAPNAAEGDEAGDAGPGPDDPDV